MQLNYVASNVYPSVSSQREKNPQLTEKAPAQIATMCKHTTNTSPIMTLLSRIF